MWWHINVGGMLFFFFLSVRTRLKKKKKKEEEKKKAFGGWGIKFIHGGAHTYSADVFSCPLVVGPLHPPGSSRLRDVSGALDDMSLRKIAVTKRLGKVFCMGIRVFVWGGHTWPAPSWGTMEDCSRLSVSGFPFTLQPQQQAAAAPLRHSHA